MSFGWEAPLVVNGEEVAISDYLRYDNPFVQSDFNSQSYVISDDQYALVLDFNEGQGKRAAILGDQIGLTKRRSRLTIVLHVRFSYS